MLKNRCFFLNGLNFASLQHLIYSCLCFGILCCSQLLSSNLAFAATSDLVLTDDELLIFRNDLILTDNDVLIFRDDLAPVSDVPLEMLYEQPGYYGRKYNLFPNWITLGGSIRNRFEKLSGVFRRGPGALSQQWPLRTRLFLGLNPQNSPLQLIAEYQDSRAFLSQPDSPLSTSHFDEHEMQQLHIDWHTHNIANTGLDSDIQFGRVNMDLGLGRWIARNNFRNTTNSYDGVYWKLGNVPGALEANLFAVYPVDIQVKSMNRWFNQNENFIWGGYVLLPEKQQYLPKDVRLELNYIHHSSDNHARDFNMLGYHFFKQPIHNRWFFDYESQYQFGNISANTHFAQFYHLNSGYVFPGAWQPELSFLFDYASSGFDILYGRRSFELAPTGILGPFQRSNLVSAGYRLFIAPFERFNIYLQQRASWLQNPRFPWVSSGLVDPSGKAGRYLGESIEVRSYWLLTNNILIESGYFFFDYGRFPKTAPQTPVTHNTNYAFLQVEFVF